MLKVFKTSLFFIAMMFMNNAMTDSSENCDETGMTMANENAMHWSHCNGLSRWRCNQHYDCTWLGVGDFGYCIGNDDSGGGGGGYGCGGLPYRECRRADECYWDDREDRCRRDRW